MALMTPSLNASGVFSLRSPWNASSSVIYTVIAIRKIDDFVDRGVDVLSKVYTPVGLTNAELTADRAEGASIITLVSAGQPTIYVPDTYIESFPALDGVPYSYLILSLSLGAVADSLDLSFVKERIQGTVSDSFGITPTITEHRGASTGYVTQDQHTSIENARNAAITNRTTDHAKSLELQNLVDSQAQKIAELEAVIRQLSPP
jgi:hypothetical protein